MLRVGLTEMDIAWENRTENMNRAEALCREAKDAGVELLIFPEMTLTGFTMNGSEMENFAEDTAFFKAMAKKYNMAIAYGTIQKTEDGACLNKLLIASDADENMDYTKLHPFTYGGEDKVYSPGTKLAKQTVKDVRLWGYICYDLRFPEIFSAAAEDVDAIMVIANWPASRADQWHALLKARAIENQTYALGVNRIGTGDDIDYAPSSCAYDFLGSEISTRVSKHLLIADLDTSAIKDARKKFPVLNDRRPELYKLLKNS